MLTIETDPMRPEDAKALMAVRRYVDSPAVDAIVRRYIETLRLMTDRQSQPNSYSVEAWAGGEWSFIAAGSKDYCIGFASAKDDDCASVDRWRVTCGGSVIWPDKWWLADARLSQDELNDYGKENGGSE